MATVPAILLLYGGSWAVGRTLSAVRDAASGAESAGATAAETRLLIRLALHDLDRLLSHAESRLHATPASHVDARRSGGSSSVVPVGLTPHEASCVAALWTGSIVPHSTSPSSDPVTSPGVGGSPTAAAPPPASLDVSATGSMLSRASGGSSERPRTGLHRRARLSLSPPRGSQHDGARDSSSSSARHDAPPPETEDDEAFALVSLAARPTVLYREFQPAASEATAGPMAGTPRDHLPHSRDGGGDAPLHQHAPSLPRRVSQGTPSPPPSPPPFPGFSATQLGHLSLLLRRLAVLLAAHRQYLDRGEWTRLLADLEVRSCGRQGEGVGPEKQRLQQCVPRACAITRGLPYSLGPDRSSPLLQTCRATASVCCAGSSACSLVSLQGGEDVRRA